MESYHSALKPSRPADPIQAAHLARSWAFVHDIRDGLPSAYDLCDVFYTDLPWRDGFKVFEQRAGQLKADHHHRDYAQFLLAVSMVIHKMTRPLVIVTGKHALPYLPKPTNLYVTKLNGAPAAAFAYNLQLFHLADATDILDELAQRFECAGDFCCGYGRTAKAFHDRGKRFVVSDYNAMCIGHMASEWGKW
jgi:hypothetical protein